MSAEFVQLPVRRIMRHCNPFARRVTPWDVHMSRALVRSALFRGLYEPEPWTGDRLPKLATPAQLFDWHAKRIAYLVINHASNPIEIDVGCPALGCHVEWMVQDGNHRLAAAIFRGDEWINASVSGELAYAKRLFGVDCSAPH